MNDERGPAAADAEWHLARNGCLRTAREQGKRAQVIYWKVTLGLNGELLQLRSELENEHLRSLSKFADTRARAT
jgi:hypothetical protein